MGDKPEFASARAVIFGALAAAFAPPSPANRIRRETSDIAAKLGDSSSLIAEHIARLNALADEIERSRSTTFRQTLSESVSRRLSVKQVAHKFNMSERSVQRIAPEVGQKIGGRWEIDVRKMAEKLAGSRDAGPTDLPSNNGENDV